MSNNQKARNQFYSLFLIYFLIGLFSVYIANWVTKDTIMFSTAFISGILVMVFCMFFMGMMGLWFSGD